MYIIGGYGTGVPPAPCCSMPAALETLDCPMILGHVSYPSVSVEVAAKVLRMNPKTLYRNMHEIPHTRIGNYYRIPVSFLFFEYVPDAITRRFDSTKDPLQYEFEYDVPLRTVQRYRNTREIKKAWDYENRLWRVKK